MPPTNPRPPSTTTLFVCEMEGATADAAMAGELLGAIDIEFSSTADLDTGVARYTAYFDTESEATAAAETLRTAVEEWRETGVTLSPPVVKPLLKEDWTEVWKRHFAVQRISPTLVVRPSWLEHIAAPGETVLHVDPGMSFGTGAHETTQFCLKAIEDLTRGGGNSFLDVGCGSGILTVAAVKFGCAPVVCLDNDAECIATTRENLERNAIPETQVDMHACGLEAFEPKNAFDIVVANIISSVLTAHAERLVSWVAPGGHLVIAGILAREYDDVKRAFEATGLRELHSATEKEWTGGVFTR